MTDLTTPDLATWLDSAAAHFQRLERAASSKSKSPRSNRSARSSDFKTDLRSFLQSFQDRYAALADAQASSTALQSELDLQRNELELEKQRLVERQAEFEARFSKAATTATLAECNQVAAAGPIAEFCESLATQVMGTIEQQLLELLNNGLPELASHQSDLLSSRVSDASVELTLVQGRLHETEAELGSVKNELQELIELLESGPTESTSDESQALVETLRCELADLRAQNADLAAQIAQFQMRVAQNKPHLCLSQESLSWEERKRLILAQLDTEADEAHSDEPQGRLEIAQVVRATQIEIDRRDSEIEELRSIVEQQSDSHGGLAVGAAAVAQLIDADELIQQEREKLRCIQVEWESKLRQAEIEMSLEREKLARERTQLNERQGRDAFLVTPNRTEGTSTKPSRKWLEHLGLGKDA